MRLLPALLIVAFAAGLAGCPKKPTTVPDTTAEAPAAQPGAGAGVADDLVGRARDLPAEGAAVGAAPAGVATVIYFDFDRSDIRPEFTSVINADRKSVV